MQNIRVIIINKIYTIHSEVISLEDPVKNITVKKYIAIRPEIKDYLISTHDISEKSIEVIYNPIDEKKFKPSNQPSENFTSSLNLNTHVFGSVVLHSVAKAG